MTKRKRRQLTWINWHLVWKHCYPEFICDFFVLNLLVQRKNIFNFLLVFFVKMAACCSNVDFSLQCIGSSSTLFGFSALDKLLFSVLVQHDHNYPHYHHPHDHQPHHHHYHHQDHQHHCHHHHPHYHEHHYHHHHHHDHHYHLGHYEV